MRPIVLIRGSVCMGENESRFQQMFTMPPEAEYNGCLGVKTHLLRNKFLFTATIRPLVVISTADNRSRRACATCKTARLIPSLSPVTVRRDLLEVLQAYPHDSAVYGGH